MTRRARLWLAVGLVVVVVAAAAFAVPRLWPANASGAPHYVEESAAAGLDHVYDGDFFYFVGGGVAVFDCDGDGRQDLYLAGGSRPAALFRNQSPVGGALKFERVPAASTDLGQVVGAYPIDIDGDGISDLAVLRLGGNVLLRGTGDCAFTPANERWGVPAGDAWTAAFSATWESPDSLPTLAYGNYLQPASVQNRSYVCDDNQLLRPAASGRRYAPPVALSPGFCTLSILFSDWDRSGDADLRVSNDRHYYRFGEEQLWHVMPGQPPSLWTQDEGWQPVHIWGMGIASYDLTGDGYPEVYLTSQADNRLQTLAAGPSQPRYEDIAVARGATAHEPYTGDVEMRSTAWHAEFEDVNNDGLMDLFVSKGNVEAQADYAARDPNNLLMERDDGTFVEGGLDAGIANFARGRGAALADLNLDGLLDLVVVNRRVNVSLFRNVGSGTAEEPRPMGNWTAIRLQEDGSNRDAIGAWVEVAAGSHVERREITIGGGHAGGQLGWIHFGLGTATQATLTVTWPDGSKSAAMPVRVNGFGIVQRGVDHVEPWSFDGGGG
jgi:enediyne biosynthesis protein E4